MVRVKKRYFVIEIQPGDSSNFSVKNHSLLEAIKAAIQRLHGEFGLAATLMGLRVKYFNSTTRIAILSANRGSHHLVCSALPIITQIGSHPASLKTLLVTATMKLGFTFVKANHKNMLSIIHKTMKPSDTKEEFERRVQQSRIFESQVQ